MATAHAILDTNVLVAAGFNRRSASARLVAEAFDARLTLIWCEATRAENRSVLNRIPRLEWSRIEPLFLPDARHPDPEDLAHVAFVEDPEDRKFAALSLATGIALVSNDDHLLSHADKLDVLKPSAYVARMRARAGPAPAS